MNIVDGSDSSSQSEQSDRSSHSSQSDSSEYSSESSRTDSGESSEASSGKRRKADRGEMEPLVENYIKEGLSAPDIVDRVYNVDRLLTYQGKKLEAKRVYVIKNRMKDKEPSAPSQQASRSDRQARSYQSVRSQRAEPSQPRKIPVRLEDSFRDFRDLPRRKREGRKHNRTYKKFNTTLDSELWKRFEAEMDRLRWPMADVLELILFNAFGHPALSYAEPEVSEPEKPRARGRRVKEATGGAKSRT